jgi:hypothetical protein
MYGHFPYLNCTPFCHTLNSHLVALRYVTSNLDILQEHYCLPGTVLIFLTLHPVQGVSKCHIRDCTLFHWPYTKVWHSTDLNQSTHATDFTPKHGKLLTLHRSTHATDLIPKRDTLLTLDQSTHATDLTPKYGTLLTLHQSTHDTDLTPKHGTPWNERQSMPRYSTLRTLNNVKNFVLSLWVCRIFK